MNVEIANKKQEPLMKRIYFEAKLIFEGKTPSRLDIKKDLCHHLSSKEALTVIRKIITDYGSERAIVSGYAYDDEAAMKKLESRYTMLRHLSKAERVAEKEKIKVAKLAAAPAAAKKKK